MVFGGCEEKNSLEFDGGDWDFLLEGSLEYGVSYCGCWVVHELLSLLFTSDYSVEEAVYKVFRGIQFLKSVRGTF